MRNFLLATTFALGATTAFADAPAAYVGAGVTQADIDHIFGSGNSLNLHSTAWKAFAGFRPISSIAVEADYMDLRSNSRSFGFLTSQANVHAFAAYAVGFLPLPLPFLDVFGKAGLARWDLSGHTDPSFFALDNHGTDFAWGGGGQLHYGPWAARLEYEQFQVRNPAEVKAVTLGISFNFL